MKASSTFRIPLLYSLLPAGLLLAALSQDADPLQKKFEELDAKGDRAPVVALFKEHPFEVLYMLDGYLEGALAKIEKGGDSGEIKRMHEKALRGASDAEAALGKPMIRDYVASYVDFGAPEQKQFREGQKSSGEARKALKAKDFKSAKAAAEATIQHARPLGDWWGAGSGYTALAEAEEGLGNWRASVDAAQQARLIHQSLNFVRDEYRDLQIMARVLVQIGNKSRATAVIEQGLALSKSAGDKNGGAAFLELRKKLDEKK